MEMSTLANLEQSLLLAKHLLVICYAFGGERGRCLWSNADRTSDHPHRPNVLESGTFGSLKC